MSPATDDPAPHNNEQKRGVDILHDPRLNKGTAFTPEERDELGLRGLLPPKYLPIEEQLELVYENYSHKESDLEKYIYLIGLLDRNETLFYRLLEGHLEEMMPVVYTPTVGLACQRYSRIFRRPRGLCISLRDRGRVDNLLANWPYRDIRIIVVTDGERILGLGDLGLNGMGIPVGKLNLYVAAAGIDPSKTLPICLDVGTNNEELRQDPLYLGLDRPRERGENYDELIDELINAARARWPHCIIQFEDFGNTNAFRLLEKYRDVAPVFNDDIQGTGAVILAGLLGALRITKQPLSEQRIVFLGAGEAGIGIAEAIMTGMKEEGLTDEEAKQRFWHVDSKGLVTRQRPGELAPHKLLFARDEEPVSTLGRVVERVQPTILLGVSGKPGLFNEMIVRVMARQVERPIIFALSNPTSKAECTAQQAYTLTDGRAIFASGSPFDPLTIDGRFFRPGQGNNAYIFPGVGLGAIISGAKRIVNSMFHQAAMTLARAVSEELLEEGSVYPRQSDSQKVSLDIAAAVAREVYRLGLNSEPEPDDLESYIRDWAWKPEYTPYV
ncbi:MAG: oxaloacetate-decarboxylating malate dehydrogenase [Calditrichaeota bacterium]|nr:oxaloacetate-decarboxylating malate dehydrogenase [Calditrichota bacterium]